MNKPKVLFLLCSYNGEKYITDQINSILNQIDIEITLLIFDDNSFDNTVLYAKNIKDPRVTVSVNKYNSGSPALNFIKSIKNLDFSFISKYDYISLCDQDDIWLPIKTIRAISLMENNNCDLYASNLTIWDTNTNSKKHTIKKDYQQVEFDYLFEGASAGCTYVISTKLIINFIKDVMNIDFTKWKYLSHDWLFYFYARITKQKVIIDSNSYIYYRIHDTNVHGTMNLFSIRAFLKKIKLFYSGWYNIQTLNYSNYMLNDDNVEKYIYSQYNKNWFSRIGILILYNRKLFRSKKKFFIFFFFNLFYFKKYSKNS